MLYSQRARVEPYEERLDGNDDVWETEQLRWDGGVMLSDPTDGSGERPIEELLESASSGDPEAFGVLYQRYVNRIYGYVYYRTGNHHDAEDLTARVFFRALRHIPNYQHRGVPFSAWLYRIAHNLVANWHRDNSRRKILPLDYSFNLFREKELPERVLMEVETEETLLDAIRELPADRQQLLILKYVDRLSNAEIGEVMGRTEGAIKSLYHRTLLALRDELAHRADLREGS